MIRITVQPNTFIKQVKTGWQSLDQKKHPIGVFPTERMAREMCIMHALKSFTFPKEEYERWLIRLHHAEQIAGV